MRNRLKLILLVLGLSALVLAPAAVSLASTIIHMPDSKTYEISGLTKDNENFKDLYAYFDKSSGQRVESNNGDGSTATFTLANTPLEVISISVGGSLVPQNSTNGYTISGATVTFHGTYLPANGKVISFMYRVQAGGELYPYLISNSIHLRNLAKLQNTGVIPDSTHFSLSTSFQYEGEDANHNPIYLDPIGNTAFPFKGTFNGNNKTITGLTIKSSEEYVGMFGKIAGGIVKNFILASPSLTSTYATAKVGFVCGNFDSGTLQRIGVYGGNGTAHIDKATMTLASGSTKKTVRYLIGEGTIPADIVFLSHIPSLKAGHLYCDVTHASSGWNSTIYAYAWKSDQITKVNSSWPGVTMTLDSTGVYRANIPNAFDRVIFSYGSNGTVTAQTGDLTIDRSTPYCSITGTTTATWSASPWSSDTSTSTQTNITASSVSIYRDSNEVHVS